MPAQAPDKTDHSPIAFQADIFAVPDAHVRVFNQVPRRQRKTLLLLRMPASSLFIAKISADVMPLSRRRLDPTIAAFQRR